MFFINKKLKIDEATVAVFGQVLFKQVPTLLVYSFLEMKKSESLFIFYYGIINKELISTKCTSLSMDIKVGQVDH